MSRNSLNRYIWYFDNAYDGYFDDVILPRNLRGILRDESLTVAERVRTGRACREAIQSYNQRNSIESRDMIIRQRDAEIEQLKKQSASQPDRPPTVQPQPTAPPKKRGRKVNPMYIEGYNRAYIQDEDLNDVVKELLGRWAADQSFSPTATDLADTEKQIRSGIGYQRKKRDKNTDN